MSRTHCKAVAGEVINNTPTPRCSRLPPCTLHPGLLHLRNPGEGANSYVFEWRQRLETLIHLQVRILEKRRDEGGMLPMLGEAGKVKCGPLLTNHHHYHHYHLSSSPTQHLPHLPFLPPSPTWL